MRRIWEPEGKEKNMEEKEKPNYRGLPLILIAAYCKVLIFNYVPSVLRLVAGLFIWFNLALPLRNEQNLGEVSLFHIHNSLTAGMIAGFVEEIFFRGFFMTELAGAGFGNTAQVTISAIL